MLATEAPLEKSRTEWADENRIFLASRVDSTWLRGTIIDARPKSESLVFTAVPPM